MRMVGPLHGSLEERKNVLVSRMREADLPPGLGVSCQDGILLVAVKNTPRAFKIRRVFDRFAFAAVGVIDDYERLYRGVAAQAKVSGHVILSAGDGRIFQEAKGNLTGVMREEFRNLYSTGYFECEVILAQVGFCVEEDELYKIDCVGEATTSNAVLIPQRSNRVPDAVLEQLQQSGITMEEAMSRIYDGMNLNASTGAFMEVVCLSRQLTLAKKFDQVYQKLSLGLPGSLEQALAFIRKL